MMVPGRIQHNDRRHYHCLPLGRRSHGCWLLTVFVLIIDIIVKTFVDTEKFGDIKRRAESWLSWISGRKLVLAAMAADASDESMLHKDLVAVCHSIPDVFGLPTWTLTTRATS